MTPCAFTFLASPPFIAPPSPLSSSSLAQSHTNDSNGINICRNCVVVTAISDLIKVRKSQKMCRSSRGRQRRVCAAEGGEVYQPFRPPVMDTNSSRLSAEEQLQVLRDRRVLWHQLAPHIASLSRLGFAPSSIEERTGISGVEQNELVVASQVRSSLEVSRIDRAALDFFDAGGSDILYELRILSADQRKSAAEYAILRRMDAKGARELARAVKDYSRRKGTEGWQAFSSSPADSMAFACYRASKEYSKDDPDRKSILEKGLGFVESRAGRLKLLKALDLEMEAGEKEDAGAGEREENKQLNIVELNLDEVTGFVMLAVADANSRSIEAAPYQGALESGPLGIYRSQTPWEAWVALPAWEAFVAATAPLAVLFPNMQKFSTILSSKTRIQGPVLVIVDKGESQLEESTFYLVAEEKEGDALSILSGSAVIQTKRKPLAKLLIALKLPLHVANSEYADWS